MTPLDLRQAPPRSPRIELAGLAYTARVVDKLRASLPGGNLNGYLALAGYSLLWAASATLDLRDLREAIAGADDEAAVDRWIDERTAGLDKTALNARMARIDTRRMPEQMRPVFEALYPADLRERFPIFFDLLEADDARLYRATPAPERSLR